MTTTAPTTRAPSNAPQAVRNPDFLIIGAAKAGTTTLYQRVFMTDPKEPDFFGSAYHRGHNWYHDLFAHARPD